MALSDRAAAISPTIIGSVRRFRRVFVLLVVVCILIALIYTVTATKQYSAKAGIAIAPLPASLTTPGSASVHLTPVAYTDQQVTLLESTAVTNGAAAAVNTSIPSAHLTGKELQGALTVKPPGAVSSGASTSTTQVIVTLSNPKVAAEGANAVVAAYITALHAQVRTQAAQSQAALDAAITSISNQLKGLPAPTKSPTHTTTTTAPRTTTTRPPSTTTTRPPPTTTTRPPSTTTTRPPPTTTTRPPSTTTTTSPKTTTTTTTSATAALRDGTTSTSTTSTSTTSTSTGAAATSMASTTAALRDGPTNTADIVVRRQPAILLASAQSSASTTTTTTTAASTGATTTTTTTPSTSTSTADANTKAQRAILQSTLAGLTQSKAQITVNEALDLAFRPTVVPAKPPTSAANGKYTRNLGIGLAVGLVLGMIAAFALASSRRRFEKADDPEHLYGVPMIAAVPAIELDMWVQTGLPILTHPTNEAAEAYRSMATALRAARGTAGCLVVAVTAADLGAGTTTTVANCGLALSEMGERTVIVDADALGRGLTRALVEETQQRGLPQAPRGLSDLLTGRFLADTLAPASVDSRLMVMPSGRDTDMAVHRWRTATLRTALEELSERFDMVLIDTPPMGTSSYGTDIVATTGHVILVVPHHDRVDLHEEVAERLALAGASLLGYVYNGAPPNIRFAPYYPVVFNGLGGASPQAPRPVSSGLGRVATSPPPDEAVGGAIAVETATTDPGASPTADDRHEASPETRPEDDTGVVGAVNRTLDDDTGVVSAVSHHDEDFERQAE